MTLNRCKGCPQEEYLPEPDIYTRWSNDSVLYHWVQCGGIYACETGPCMSTPDDAVDIWNELAAKNFNRKGAK